MFEIIIGVLSGLASAVVVAGFFWSIFADLKREIKHLEIGRIDKIECRLEEHLKQDNPEAQQLQLNNILGALTKLSDKFDRQCEFVHEMELKIGREISSLSTSVGESRNFTQNLYKSMQTLREEIHHGERPNLSSQTGHIDGSF